MEHTIRLVETTLTDGSRAYDVVIVGHNSRFPCISFKDACLFIDAFQKAVDANTNETVALVELQELA